MHFRSRIDQLRRYSNEIALVSNAAFEQVIDRELAADLARAFRGSFEPHRRAPREHAELAGAEAPDLGDHFLGEAVAEVLLSWIVAHVRKRQHDQAKRAGLLLGFPDRERDPRRRAAAAVV